MFRFARINSITTTLVLGALISITGFVYAHFAEESAMLGRFERAVENRAAAIRRGAGNSLIKLQSVGAVLATFDDVGHEQFRDYTEPILTSEPEIHGIYWTPRVLAHDRRGFEDAMRRSGQSEFTITEIHEKDGVIRANPREEFFPVTYVVSRAECPLARGFDMASDSVCRESLERAGDTARIVASAGLRFPSPGKVETRFIVAVPVYDQGNARNTPNTRKSNLKGFVVGLLGPAEIVAEAMAYLQPEGVDFFVYDSSSTEESPLYVHISRTRASGELAAELRPSARASSFRRTARIELAGRTWLMVATPSAWFLARNDHSGSWSLLIAGLIVTGMLANHLRSSETRTVDLATANMRLEREVAERKTIEARLRHDSCHDALTNLPNRTALMERLERCVMRAKRQKDHLFAVLFLDIDNFKLINDSLGHCAGDTLLIEMANRLETCLRCIDTVSYANEEATARLGGDEFVVLLDRVRNRSDALFIAERIHQQLSQPYDLLGHKIVITVSIGVALSDCEYETAEDLLRYADTAMYRAKSSGKAQHAVFDETMHAEALTRLQLEHDLVHAVERKQFSLVYQPIIELESGKIAGFEALLRWQAPGSGTRTPKEFMVVAEEIGLAVPIGAWVLEEACRTLSSIGSNSPVGDKLFVCVNVAQKQLTHPGFVGAVRRVIKATSIEATSLHLEISEKALLDSPDTTRSVLEELKSLGVGLHMDNFGRGYSSIRYLQELPLDVVDIDTSLIGTMDADRQFVSIVRAIVELAHNLNMRVLAEGIERDEQLASVLALDCDFAQGRHFCEPLDPDAIKSILTTEAPWLKNASSHTSTGDRAVGGDPLSGQAKS